jgi:ATP-dependent Clp protease ATP-binding subunit ClpA
MRTAGTKFLLHCSGAAKEMLLREGIDYQYGARHLKRSIERLLVQPLSNLIATGQVGFADSVYVDLDAIGKLMFSKRSDPALIDELQRVLEETEQSAAVVAAVTPQLANAKTAGKSSEFGGLGGWCF